MVGCWNCSLHKVHSTQRTEYIEYIVQSTEYTVHRVDRVHSTEYTVHSTEYTVQSTQDRVPVHRVRRVLSVQSTEYLNKKCLSTLKIFLRGACKWGEPERAPH